MEENGVNVILQRAELQSKIWKIANEVRGAVDGWDFKQFVLGTLFYRFISENFTSYIERIMNLFDRKEDVEYTLRDINKPMGVSEYHLTNAIPDDIKSQYEYYWDILLSSPKNEDV